MYQCGKCKYRFSPKVEGKVPTICPYCGEKGHLMPEVKADDLIKDVDNLI